MRYAWINHTDPNNVNYGMDAYPRTRPIVRYRKWMLKLLILDNKQFETISKTYLKKWGQKGMSNECKMQCNVFLHNENDEWDSNKKVKEKTELKQLCQWYMDVFVDFWSDDENDFDQVNFDDAFDN